MRPVALALCLALASSVAAADPSPEPEGASDAKTILGSWQAVKAIRRGDPLPPAGIEKMKLEVTKDKLTIIEQREKGTREERVDYVLDMKTKPRAIDLILTSGAKGAKVLGIYKIEKGELTIVTGNPDGPRPKAFDEKDRTVLVFRKAKAKK